MRLSARDAQKTERWLAKFVMCLMLMFGVPARTNKSSKSRKQELDGL